MIDTAETLPDETFDGFPVEQAARPGTRPDDMLVEQGPLRVAQLRSTGTWRPFFSGASMQGACPASSGAGSPCMRLTRAAGARLALRTVNLSTSSPLEDYVAPEPSSLPAKPTQP